MSFINLYLKSINKKEEKLDIAPLVEKPNTIYSEQVNDSYIVKGNGVIEFISGVKYNKRELEIIKRGSFSTEVKRKIHLIKQYLSGELVK